MCSKCPVDTANLLGGKFDDCKRMFLIDSKPCERAIKKYMDNTDCDNDTPKAWDKYYKNKSTDPNYTKEVAGQVLDRLVYTLCKLGSAIERG